MIMARFRVSAAAVLGAAVLSSMLLETLSFHCTGGFSLLKRPADSAAGRSGLGRRPTLPSTRSCHSAVGFGVGSGRVSMMAESGSSADLQSEDGQVKSSAQNKSVLVIAWFYAEPKQIELVRRIYLKRGFNDVVVQESPVHDISTPRGWFKTYSR